MSVKSTVCAGCLNFEMVMKIGIVPAEELMRVSAQYLGKVFRKFP